MFSFIKSFQEFIIKLKSNKKQWYTIISVTSIVGIVTTIYLLLSLTGHVAEKVYISMSETYKLKVDTKVEGRKNEFRKIAIVLDGNDAVRNAIAANNTVAMGELQVKYKEKFAAGNYQNLMVQFYSAKNTETIIRNSITSSINSKSEMFGVEVLADGVFFILLHPVLDGENVVGIIEVRDSIHSMRQDFEFDGGEFVFILDKKMMEVLSLKAKSGRYKDVVGDYKVEQAAYDTKFNATLAGMDSEEFKHFQEHGIEVTEQFYRTYKKVTDVNGADIGLYVVGEGLQRKGGIIHMADDMSKEVSAIALGMIISIILFMF